MFENLLYQDELRDLLKQEVTTGQLPPALLFTGPAQSGKMTAALELARVLSCKSSGAPWKCSCPSCRQHRLLESPYLLLMGRRRFSDEILAAQKMFREGGGQGLEFLFARNVKKLIRRFDPLLWQDNKPKLNKAIKLIEKLEEQQEAGNITIKLLTDLEKLLPQDGVTINMVRQAIYWSRTADRSLSKVIIIENADILNESASNTLLKILEEPPSQTVFILTTERPRAIVPTILSRLRLFRFMPRKTEQSRDIISRVYRSPETKQYRTVQDFFDAMLHGGTEFQQQKIKLLLTLLKGQDIEARDQLINLLGSDRRELRQLIILSLNFLQQSMHREQPDPDALILQRKLEEMAHRCGVYNIPVASALEYGYI